MTQSTCPSCGAALSAGGPAGLCPRCLLQRGMENNTEGFTVPEKERGGAKWQPPAVGELAGLFPELEIVRLIGRGGMGAVYQARQRSLDRVVALKILPPEMGNDAAFAERFAREAQAMARLNHPHIVAIYEFGHRGGAPEARESGRGGTGLYFFLMEYVDGVSLRGLLDSGHVSPKEALAIVPQICEALQYAHDQGIVHRDIKPENILLNKQGQVKIADFGLAKLIGRAFEPALAAAVEKVMGTPQYMAPEQVAHPGEVDHRADIYSLGVVFYQMLTGELPAQRLEPPSRKVQIDVRLDQIVLRALEQLPERRYQQASEVRTEVETILTTPFEASAPAGAHRAAVNVDAVLEFRKGRPWQLSKSVPYVGTIGGRPVLHWPGILLIASLVAIPSYLLPIICGMIAGSATLQSLRPIIALIPPFIVVVTVMMMILKGMKAPIDRLRPLDNSRGMKVLAPLLTAGLHCFLLLAVLGLDAYFVPHIVASYAQMTPAHDLLPSISLCYRWTQWIQVWTLPLLLPAILWLSTISFLTHLAGPRIHRVWSLAFLGLVALLAVGATFALRFPSWPDATPIVRRIQLEEKIRHQIGLAFAARDLAADDIQVQLQPDLSAGSISLRNLRQHFGTSAAPQWRTIEGRLNLKKSGADAWAVVGDGELPGFDFIVDSGNPAPDTRFTSALPEGRVELIWISDDPPGRGLGWLPDGSASTFGPFDANLATFTPNANFTIRHVAFRNIDLPPFASRPKLKSDPNDASLDGGWYNEIAAKSGDIYLRNGQLFDARLPRGAAFATIQYGVAWGPWKTIALYDNLKHANISPELVNRPTPSGPVVPPDWPPSWNIEFKPPTEKDGEATIGADHYIKDAECRIIAITTDGTPQTSVIMGNVTMQWSFDASPRPTNSFSTFYKLPLAQIQAFEFQVRPYHWATFRNVALNPRVQAAESVGK